MDILLPHNLSEFLFCSIPVGGTKGVTKRHGTCSNGCIDSIQEGFMILLFGIVKKDGAGRVWD